MGGLAAIGGSGPPGPASLRIGAGRWPAVGWGRRAAAVVVRPWLAASGRGRAGG